ncbi:transcriptional regulator TrmB [Streptomyces caelestis]|uniref:Transcriptional regulator TrmB n=2 Tax=Streptomyces TaxID=1883 RepID=A0A0M8QDI5_9ACTN|nr:transcriptional regulator TrmB [Streptomyces caelestis]KOV22299.1 transcriptional regulator TrmB [Streptomyces sp. XY152]
MLGPVGLSRPEESVYLLLLRRGSASPDDLAAASSLEPGRVRRIVKGLRRKGFVHQTPPPDERVVPVAPDMVVDHLIRRRHDELEAVRTAAHRLAEEARGREGNRRAGELIEIVTGGEAVGQAFDRLQRGARRELRVLVTPPYAAPKDVNESQLDRLLARGVVCRAVYGTVALDDPAIAAGVAACVRAGEQARLAHRVPIKLALADESLALLPLSWSDAAHRTALLVHPCGLLDALSALFETVWSHAVPLSLGPDDRIRPAATLSDEDRYLLSLLVSGLTDDAVAARLGVSRRTVVRRVTHLMERADARSRLQLGWQAHERGWL